MPAAAGQGQKSRRPAASGPGIRGMEVWCTGCGWLSLAPGGQALLAAIGTYESQMREYGYAAVAASRAAEAEMSASRRGIGYWLYRRLAGPSAAIGGHGRSAGGRPPTGQEFPRE